LKAFILERAPGAAIRRAVDHAPILERAYAQEAGVGFIGKHTLLITPDHGSWVLLAELITDLELDVDEPGFTQCGTCTRCLDACPTGALTEPYQLDATRCIAYLTIELKGETPVELSRRMGDWVFGCDVCQEACPYNHDAASTPVFPELRRDAGAGPWLSLDDALRPRSHSAFDRRFASSPLHRAGRNGLRRNALVVQTNHHAGEPIAETANHELTRPV
jgi:epoxyqueuosine reductase